jgi:hypothetical protein
LIAANHRKVGNFTAALLGEITPVLTVRTESTDKSLAEWKCGNISYKNDFLVEKTILFVESLQTMS